MHLPPPASPAYVITTLAYPGAAITQTDGLPTSLNDRDEVVGSAFTRPSTFEGFVWRKGNFTVYDQCTALAAIDAHGLAVGYTSSGYGDCRVNTAKGTVTFGTPPGPSGGFHVAGINAQGVAVGQGTTTNHVTVGLLFGGHQRQTLLVPGSHNKYGGTEPTGINDGGTVVGTWSDTGGTTHGFTYAAGSYGSFDYPGATGTYPYFITASGDVGGGYLASGTGGTTLPFVRIGGTYEALDPPGSIGGYTVGIGAAGQVAGTYLDASHVEHGFVLQAGAYTDISVQDAQRTTVDAINAGGTLLGTWYDGQGIAHAFVARPSGS